MPEIGTAAATNSSGIAPSRKGPCDAAMSTKSRHVIYGSRIAGAKISARMMPMRANIVGPPSSTTSSRASIAACQSGAACSGSLVM
jgi:hypothetical protein